MKIPLIKGNPAWPDITKVLLTPDPGMWNNLVKACKETMSLDLSSDKRKRCEEIEKFATAMEARENAKIKT